METGSEADLTVELDDVSPAVRRKLAGYASDAIPSVPEAELPIELRRFVGFTSAKRARLGAPALLAALQGSPQFRAAVVGWLREHRPAKLAVDQVDMVSGAAAAILLGRRDVPDLLDTVDRRGEDARLRRQRDEALARVERLEVEIARLETERETTRALATPAPGTDERGDADRLRSRLREQGARLRRILDDSAELVAKHATEMSELQTALAAAHGELDRERARTEAASRRAERLSAQLDGLRNAAREGRRADEMRLRLLIDTIAGASAGLRRELGLSTVEARDPRPADLVGGTTDTPTGGPVPDGPALDRLLELPAVHLIVDGYNVTKTGYPELTLSRQRDRLAAGLAALAARTGAEVTLVFDGAAATGTAGGPRGVRVLFSAAGVLADDLIRDIVAAEPAGRPLGVVTSDRDVVLSVRAAGAYTATSDVLLERLAKT